MRYFDVTNPVGRIAFFWGLMAFMPVGMNYLGLFMLFGAVLWHQDVKTRWLRLWGSMMGPALLLFAGWTLLVLVLQPSWYVQSASNLWHGMRIFLTIALAASLSKNEALAALQGFMLSSACAVVLILAYKFGVLDSHPYWQHLLEPGTNKSIGASILLCMFVAILVASALSSSGRSRWFTLLVALVVMVILVETLSKRTGMVACILALVCVTLHLWRKHKWRWALAVVALALSCVLLWITSPGLQAQFVQGIREVKEGLSGIVKVESWNVRIQMVKHTLDMVAERPLLGWGIGAWNNQWQARVPVEIAGFNMPHNDFLWMGAQAGWPGAVLWLALMLSGLGLAWKTQGWKGAAATACILIACFSALVNNGTRDATIGLPMLWVVGLLISFARPDRHTS